MFLINKLGLYNDTESTTNNWLRSGQIPLASVGKMFVDGQMSLRHWEQDVKSYAQNKPNNLGVKVYALYPKVAKYMILSFIKAAKS